MKNKPFQVRSKLSLKTLIFCLWTCSLELFAFKGSTQSIDDVSISLHVKDATVEHVLQTIEQKTPFTFAYQENLISGISEKVTINAKQSSVTKVLDRVSNITNLSFKQINGNTIGINREAVTRTVTTSMSNTKVKSLVQVSGTVTDENGEPLPGASVVIKGTAKGTITDMDGKYTLSVPDDAVLVVSFLGYADQEVMVSGRSIIDVQMVVDVQSLDEVVVVGYGTTAKRDLTGSVSSVEAEDLSHTQNQSVDQRLSGVMSGVQVTSTGGAPGSAAKIYIRGLNAFQGANQPLYVVDGTPIVVAPRLGGIYKDMDGNDSSGATFQDGGANPLLAINPDDIERIDVLKDASAAAIYGSRAAHGVVLITTKHGRRHGKPEVNFSITTSIQNPLNKYKALNAQQYKAYMKKLKPDIEDSYFGDSDTDWQDVITNHNALMTKYSASVSGGTDSESYYLSGSATNHEGVFKGNRLKRYTLNAKIDSKIGKLNIGTSINYNYSINRSSNITSLMDGLKFRPDKGVYDKEGKFTLKPFNYLGVQGHLRNPVGNTENAHNTVKLHNFMGNVFGEYQILQNLTFKSQINVNVYNSNSSNYIPKHTLYAHIQPRTRFKNPLATLSLTQVNNYSTVFSNTLRYQNTWAGKHTVHVLAGISWNKERSETTSNIYYGFPDDKVLVNPSAAQVALPTTDMTSINALNSMFGRVNYTYNGKYLLTFTARRDGSIKFGPESRYGFFPSAAIAWHVEKEKFLSNIKPISNLKLRISAGKTGSDNLPTFTFSSYVSADNVAQYNGINGIHLLGKPNQKIRWGETKQVDVGLEFGLFDQRLNAEVIYFVKNTSGLIMKTDIAYQHGFASHDANLADVSNKGWELTLGGDILKNKDFRWNSSMNISWIRNRVESFNGGDFGLNVIGGFKVTTGIKEGKPIGYHVGYEVLRIAQTQEEIDKLNQNAPKGTYDYSLRQPGDYIMKDINGDGKIDDKDMIDLGSVNPNYFGGWTNRLYYKNFDFFFHFQFVQGTKKRWGNLITMFDKTRITRESSNTTTLVHDTWTLENPGAYYARLGSIALFEANNSRIIHDASFIRLRSVSLGYKLPDKWFDKTPFLSIKIRIGGNNLLTITQYPGLDPENGTQQGTRNYSFAIDRNKGMATDFGEDRGENYSTVRLYTASIVVTL